MQIEENTILLLRKKMRFYVNLISQLNIRYNHARNDPKKLGKDHL